MGAVKRVIFVVFATVPALVVFFGSFQPEPGIKISGSGNQQNQYQHRT
jgi:hypothetical protein